jgi:hypothetical protein
MGIWLLKEKRPGTCRGVFISSDLSIPNEEKLIRHAYVFLSREDQDFGGLTDFFAALCPFF